MSKWITDRLPEQADSWDDYVWGYSFNQLRRIIKYTDVLEGEPWMPITPPDKYVKPEPWSKVKWSEQHDCWMVHYPPNQYQTLLDFHDRDSKKQREAAERIGKIYEEIFEELRRWNG